MRQFATYLILQVLCTGVALAEPLALKCATEDGTPAADLIVDISKRTLSWAHHKYRIISIDDRYISAYQESDNAVGGEVWVLNRASGEYLRAGVGIFMTRAESEKKEPGKLRANTYQGKCVRPML